ncbi:MAG: histidinol-phosphate transaminase [Clostridia bacterium]|nr:histidinol-phosphate transaminase [Clostridia bacterium]MBQ2568135.1 histidinol-phosphate transaminase [Clostridia bacterium]MBQ3996118.1 histidinol-phosphate transaminase [Clostridia bacterium]MBQ4459888.1 histidinol-phosphate transaminase [Clostridia bacterium]MBQ5480317.1 histidinol-phosphate transaminase [Clostridia bacterium]
MSKYFSSKFASLEPYVPGEQPQDMSYVKLNTNESPFDPPKEVVPVIRDAARNIRLYSDPESAELRQAIADYYGLEPENVMATNGSDEALNYAFMAFCDEEHPIVFPEITYGFYPVIATLNNIPFETISLREDYTIDSREYEGINKNICIANPNAPTGIAMALEEIEQIVRTNPDNIIIIDEAYVDFGARSAVPLLYRYDNLLVTQTFSKSRSLAGGRLGFILGAKDLIADMNTLRNASNPYNINRMTAKAGIVTLRENTYFRNSCQAIQFNRRYTSRALAALGFEILPSSANFLFVRSDRIGGEELYRKLKEKGVLIRHFSDPKISDWNRVTIGTKVQMDIFLAKVEEIFVEQDEEGADQ